MKADLRSVKDVLSQTRVILRMDCDLPIEDGQILDNSRLVKSIPTIQLLLDKGCSIAIIGHRGRPEGKREEALSLKPVYLELMSLIESDPQYIIDSVFLDNFDDEEKIDMALADNNIVFFENLRFWKGEDEGDPSFLKKLIGVSQFFVNDAFAVAHRKSASILLHKQMPAYYGLSFLEETEQISRILDNPGRPLTVILGGAKKDKLDYVPELEKMVDFVLIGGKLPDFMNGTSYSDKVVMAGFSPNGLDISQESIEKFRKIISQSKTVIWAGAMGYYESPNDRKGTYEIAEAVADVDGFKVIAGGDTGASVIKLGLNSKINFICSGGGVMLEYLTKEQLPAWS